MERPSPAGIQDPPGALRPDPAHPEEIGVRGGVDVDRRHLPCKENLRVGVRKKTVSVQHLRDAVRTPAVRPHQGVELVEPVLAPERRCGAALQRRAGEDRDGR